MDDVDINPTFNLIVKLLYRVGIWREWEGSTLRRRIIKGLYMFEFLLVELFLAACALLAKDRNEITFLSLVVVIVGVILIKLVYLVLKKDEILKFLRNTTKHREDINEEQFGRVNFFLKFVNGYIGMLFVAIFVYNVSCLPWLTRDRKLPFFIRFRYTGEHSDIIYGLCYVFVGTGIVYMNVANLTTNIIWFLMQNFAVEYEILGDKLRKLGIQQMTPVPSGPTSDKKFLQDLIRLVNDHRNLLKNVEEFRSCFLILFLLHITTSGSSVCVSTYNLAFNSQNNIAQTLIYFAVMMYAFFDIFMVMYFGNEIKVASDRLSYCLFESDWTQQSTTDKKCMIILGEILKRPHELVILIYPMDLKTLTLIIKGAYTLFNVLQNFD